MSDDRHPDPDQDRPELNGPEDDALEADEATADTFEPAIDGETEVENVPEDHKREEATLETEAKRPAALERLQKILARAGIASRRHAEELITEGRVQVNGKVVTELGTKADAAHDHIRVDGKLLHGSERLRYFMLNKPKGFVTTVSDPEGRPTIMEFFTKMRERLYPVGRLDYMSEGLLLVTNDGELANKLTRAASGVEKTYLVKVSGQPSEEDLDHLREGLAIDRDKPGAGRVHTAPAQIRRFRPGKTGPGSRGAENPWFEVVLIEGRNRELRKMFEEIGHHVEKIRRVGYGPLELDLEPGKIRELEPEEVEDLRKAAEGKLRKPKRPQDRPRAEAESRFAGAKPRWNQERHTERRPESRPERRDDREGRGARRSESRPRGGFGESRPEFGRTRGGERGRFRTAPRGPAPGSTAPGGGFRSHGRSEEERPPRRDRTDRTFGGPRGGRGRFSAGESREQGAGPARHGSRPPRPESGEFRESRSGRPERKSFGRGGQQRSGGPRPFRRDREDRPSFDRPRTDERGQRPENRPARSSGPRPFRGDRDNQSRFDRPRTEERGRQHDETRSTRSSAPPSGPPRSGGFRRGQTGPSRGNSGSVRSGSGRRPGTRPPGRKPGGGKRRPE